MGAPRSCSCTVGRSAHGTPWMDRMVPTHPVNQTQLIVGWNKGTSSSWRFLALLSWFLSDGLVSFFEGRLLLRFLEEGELSEVASLFCIFQHVFQRSIRSHACPIIRSPLWPEDSSRFAKTRKDPETDILNLFYEAKRVGAKERAAPPHRPRTPPSMTPSLQGLHQSGLRRKLRKRVLRKDSRKSGKTKPKKKPTPCNKKRPAARPFPSPLSLIIITFPFVSDGR